MMELLGDFNLTHRKKVSRSLTGMLGHTTLPSQKILAFSHVLFRETTSLTLKENVAELLPFYYFFDLSLPCLLFFLGCVMSLCVYLPEGLMWTFLVQGHTRKVVLQRQVYRSSLCLYLLALTYKGRTRSFLHFGQKYKFIVNMCE